MAKYTLSYKSFIYYFSSLNVKIDVCPVDDPQKFYLSEADGYNLLDAPNSFRRS